MQEGNYKNTIVLKNVPSNIVEEAILVLKENKKVWALEKINNKVNENKDIIKKDYIVKEAEIVVTDYIEKITKKEKENQIKNKNLKYKRLKRYAFFTTFIMIIQIIINFCN